MYVSNLGFHTADDDLRKLFEPFGSVSSAKVITDRDTGKSRGFGFVEMESDNDAREAMKALNNEEIEGRSISVSEARPREDKRNSFSGGGKKRW